MLVAPARRGSLTTEQRSKPCVPNMNECEGSPGSPALAFAKVGAVGARWLMNDRVMPSLAALGAEGGFPSGPCGILDRNMVQKDARRISIAHVTSTEKLKTGKQSPPLRNCETG